MVRFKKPFTLPLSFEVRFVLGRIVQFLPVFTFVLVLCSRLNSAWFPLFVAKYVALLLLVGWITYGQAEQERCSVEQWADLDARTLRGMNFGFLKTDLICLVAGVLTAGLAFCIYKQDLRWLVVAIVLGVCLTAGWVLKWTIYDRWLDAQLRSASPDIIFTR